MYNEFSGNRCAQGRLAQERSQLHAKQLLLRQKLADYSIRRRAGLGKDLRLNHCMADSGGGVTILPDGSLGLCEHFTEDNFVGHLDREGLDGEVVKAFRERWDQIEECKTCFYYPQCIRLKKCGEDAEYFPEIREGHRQNLLAGMENTYAAWLKEETAEEEEPVC